jgi:hypothetical protein
MEGGAPVERSTSGSFFLEGKSRQVLVATKWVPWIFFTQTEGNPFSGAAASTRERFDLLSLGTSLLEKYEAKKGTVRCGIDADLGFSWMDRSSTAAALKTTRRNILRFVPAGPCVSQYLNSKKSEGAARSLV